MYGKTIRTQVHDNSDAVRHDIAITLNERAVQKRESNAGDARTAKIVDIDCVSFSLVCNGPLRVLIIQRGRVGGVGPVQMDLLDLLLGCDLRAASEIAADQVEDELGWVGVRREGMTDAVKVGRDICDGTEVAGFPTGEEKELVKELKGGCRRLVDTCDDDELRRVSLQISHRV